MTLYGGVTKEFNLRDIVDFADARLNLGIAGGSHTITAAQAIANSCTIATGLASVTSVVVQVLNTTFNVVTSDVDVTISAGNIVVADGGSYNTVENYIIRWIAVGAR